MSKSYDDAFIFVQGVIHNLRKRGHIEIKRYRQDLAGDVLEKILKVQFGSDDCAVSIDEGELLSSHPNLYRHHEHVVIKPKLLNTNLLRSLAFLYADEGPGLCHCTTKVRFDDEGRAVSNPFWEGKKKKGLKKLLGSSDVLYVQFTIDEEKLVERIRSAPRTATGQNSRTQSRMLSRSQSHASVTRRRSSTTGGLSSSASTGFSREDADLKKALELSKKEAEEEKRKRAQKERKRQQLFVQQQRASVGANLGSGTEHISEEDILKEALRASEETFRREQQQMQHETSSNLPGPGTSARMMPSFDTLELPTRQPPSIRSHSAEGSTSNDPILSRMTGARILAPEHLHPMPTQQARSQVEDSTGVGRHGHTVPAAQPENTGDINDTVTTTLVAEGDNPNEQHLSSAIAPYDLPTGDTSVSSYDSPSTQTARDVPSPYGDNPGRAVSPAIPYAVACPYDDIPSSSALHEEHLQLAPRSYDTSLSVASPYENARASVQIAPYEQSEGSDLSVSHPPLEEFSSDVPPAHQPPAMLETEFGTNSSFDSFSSLRMPTIEHYMQPQRMTIDEKVTSKQEEPESALCENQTGESTRTAETGSNTSQDGAAVTGKACVMCGKNPRQMLMYPCGHLCVCSECCKVIHDAAGGKINCPMCTKMVKDAVRVYR